VVVCYDEFGPIELRPHHGYTWSRQRKPQRLPATYSRPHGVRHFLSFYDVKRDKLWGYFRSRKRWQEFLGVLKRLRRRYPRSKRIYLILDNFSPHHRAEIKQWVSKNNIKLIWTPTNASWLNRIECQFTEVKNFVFTNTYYQSHQEVRKEMNRFINYRNARNLKRKKTFEKRH
jgi:transposase